MNSCIKLVIILLIFSHFLVLCHIHVRLSSFVVHYSSYVVGRSLFKGFWLVTFTTSVSFCQGIKDFEIYFYSITQEEPDLELGVTTLAQYKTVILSSE